MQTFIITIKVLKEIFTKHSLTLGNSLNNISWKITKNHHLQNRISYSNMNFVRTIPSQCWFVIFKLSLCMLILIFCLCKVFIFCIKSIILMLKFLSYLAYCENECKIFQPIKIRKKNWTILTKCHVLYHSAKWL